MIDKHTITGYKTVTTDMASWFNPRYKFVVGKTHTVKNAYEDGRACGEGLHFCLKRKDVEPHTKDKENYILLQVESRVEDILGMDNAKVRSKTLKIVKVLEKVEKYGAPFKKALVEVKGMKLLNSFLKPRKATTEAAIKLAAVEPMKTLGCKKLHIFSNLFELHYFLEEDTATLDPKGDQLYTASNSSVLNKFISGNEYKGFGFKALEPSSTMCLEVNLIAEKIARGYLDSASGSPVSNKNKYAKSLLAILQLGCVPLGNRNGTFLVYLPTETKLTHL